MPTPRKLPAPTFDDAYLSLRDLSSYAGMSISTLEKFIRDAVHPLPHYRFKSVVCVRRSEFDAWAAAHHHIAPAGVDVEALVEERLRAK